MTCKLYEQLGLDRFWAQRLPPSRKGTCWERILQTLSNTGKLESDPPEVATGKSNPGQGWVVVRARRLTPESVIHAMEAGDFYASTGVVIEDLRFDGKTLEMRVAARPGESCTVSFIGTRAVAGGPMPAEDTIGVLLAQSSGPVAIYTITGDELYVRARVDSSLSKEIPTVAKQEAEYVMVPGEFHFDD